MILGTILLCGNEGIVLNRIITAIILYKIISIKTKGLIINIIISVSLQYIKPFNYVRTNDLYQNVSVT